MIKGKFFENLSGVEVAEDVGGEIPHASHRPVDILEASEGFGGGCDAEELFHFLVPDRGDIFGFDGAFDDHFFDFETENHMEAIGDFVGLDADEGGLNNIDGGVKLIEGDGAELREFFFE